MKTFATITPAYDEACERWLLDSIAAVEPGAEVMVVQFDEIQGSANFQSPDFNWHNLEKNMMVRRWIRENWGGTIFVTDADIVYFRPFLDKLIGDLGDASAAFACKGMEEGYNIGQMVLRCNAGILEFFERVGEELRQGRWDEEVVNDLLATAPFPYRNISRLFTDTSSWAGLDDPSRMAAYSYHATETFPTAELTSLQRKDIRIGEVLAWRAARAAEGGFAV